MAWSTEEVVFLKEYGEKLSRKELAVMLKKEEKTISRYANRNNIALKKEHKNHVNDVVITKIRVELQKDTPMPLIADMFGVSYNYVWRVANNKTRTGGNE